MCAAPACLCMPTCASCFGTGESLQHASDEAHNMQVFILFVWAHIGFLRFKK